MHDKNKRRVFVTGASGFVGANVVRHLLKDNFEVHILSRTSKLPWRLKDISDQLVVHIGDITKYNTVKKAVEKSNPEYIIHLAAYGAYHYQTELEKIIDVNITGTRNLLEASKDVPYRCFINTGSSSEYGFKNKPMKEDDYCEPVSYYAATKLAQTHICKIFAQQNKKPIITFRLFSVYGPYEEPTRFIPVIMTSLLEEKPINLTPGKQRRDFIHVDDVACAYIEGMQLKAKIDGQVFNIGTGKEYSNDEVVKQLFAVTEKKTAINKGAYPKRSWDTAHWVADISNSKKVLRWKPQLGISQGLQKTYSWFSHNGKLYRQ